MSNTICIKAPAGDMTLDAIAHALDDGSSSTLAIEINDECLARDLGAWVDNRLESGQQNPINLVLDLRAVEDLDRWVAPVADILATRVFAGRVLPENTAVITILSSKSDVHYDKAKSALANRCQHVVEAGASAVAEVADLVSKSRTVPSQAPTRKQDKSDPSPE